MPGAPKSIESTEMSRGYSPVAIAPAPFDKYTLIGKLGHGGMAEVNLAVIEGKSNFRKLVVIKRLHAHLAAEPGFIDMFLDEARLAARLNHPHCVQTHEVGETNGSHFLAMEYLDGQGLERLLRISGQKDEPIPYDIAARIISDCLDGLAYAHELADFDGTPLGVVHRDVSPQNIFVTYNGVVKLLDFGIAKAATHVVETRTGVIKGKYAYIAPEQALAQDLDHRADLWSMGVVLWEVLTGRRLFKSINELATLHETLQGEIRLPSAFRPELPTALDTICMRALERDASVRYQSAQEMKDDLDRYLGSLPKAPGRKHIARLMGDRFGDVIEMHKQTLAQCLKGGALGMSVSSIERLVDLPMVTPTGMSPLSGAGPSVTPTPTPSGAVEVMLPAPRLPSYAAPEAKKKGGLAWRIGLVLAVALLAGAAALVLPLEERAEPSLGAAGMGRGSPEATTSEAPDPVSVVLAPTPAAAGAEPTEAPPTLDPVAAPADDAPTEPTKTGRRSRPRPQDSRSNVPAAPHPTSTPSEVASSDAPGFLTLATTPWTRVRIGSRDLGTTPLIRVELPAGTHTLQLSNPEQGIEQTYRITIPAGEAVTRRLGLQ